jgi:hypothetical protein
MFPVLEELNFRALAELPFNQAPHRRRICALPKSFSYQGALASMSEQLMCAKMVSMPMS